MGNEYVKENLRSIRKRIHGTLKVTSARYFPCFARMTKMVVIVAKIMDEARIARLRFIMFNFTTHLWGSIRPKSARYITRTCL